MTVKEATGLPAPSRELQGSAENELISYVCPSVTYSDLDVHAAQAERCAAHRLCPLRVWVGIANATMLLAISASFNAAETKQVHIDRHNCVHVKF